MRLLFQVEQKSGRNPCFRGEVKTNKIKKIELICQKNIPEKNKSCRNIVQFSKTISNQPSLCLSKNEHKNTHIYSNQSFIRYPKSVVPINFKSFIIKAKCCLQRSITTLGLSISQSTF